MPKSSAWDYPKILLTASLAALGLLYLILLVAPTRSAAGVVESWFGSAANAMMGRSTVWDWTLIAAGGYFWIYLTLGAVLLTLIAEVWGRRTSDFGRGFGFGAFAAVLTAAVEEIGDAVSDIVAGREAPWHSLEGFHDPRQFYDADLLDLPKAVPFPDENVLAWSFVVMLLATRLPRGGAVAAIGLLLHLLAQMALGSRWFFDVASSVLMGAALAGAVLWAGAGAIGWCERQSERWFLAAFWRSIAGASGLKTDDPSAREAREAEHLRIAQEEGLRSREKFWLHLVRREALPILHPGEQSWDLLREPPGADPEGFNHSPYVRFLVFGSDEIHVVKAAWRTAALYRPRRIARYRASVKNNLILERMGLPVPRQIWMKEGFSFIPPRRYCVLVEQFIDGRAIDPRDDAELALLAELLARLHGHAREGWGGMANRSLSQPARYIWHSLRAQVLFSIKQINARLQERRSKGAEHGIWELFERQGAKALGSEPARFRLTHGDVTLNNFLLGSDRVWMIDTLGAGYDLAGAEIIKAAIAAGAGEPERIALFWRAYFGAAGSERWEEFRAEAPLGLARYALRELGQGRALGGSKNTPPMEEVRRWLEGLITGAGDLFGDQPDDAEWTPLIESLLDPIDLPGKG